MFLRRASSSGILEINRRCGRLGRTRERVAPSNDQIWSNRDYLDLALVSPDSLSCMPDPFLHLFTKRASPTFNEPTTTAINILIVGTLRDSLVTNTRREKRRRVSLSTPTESRDREPTARECVRRVHALEKGQVPRFVSADSARFTGHRLTCREAGLRFISGSLLRATAYI